MQIVTADATNSRNKRKVVNYEQMSLYNKRVPVSIFQQNNANIYQIKVRG